ncbi:MAG: hypothetical protein Q4D55_09080 [Eubacteriales bacterium]|nr:hypothetical protein [Eubacteriales bacterium]
MKEREHLLVTTGIPSLFLIFSVLVLAVLALLSLGSSRSDLKTSQVSLAQTTAYFEACSQASDFCADAEDALLSIRAKSASSQDFYEAVKAYFSQFSQVTWDDLEKTALYSLDFSQRQALQVILSVDFPEEKESCIRLLSWNTAVSDQWESQVTFPVMKSPPKEN